MPDGPLLAASCEVFAESGYRAATMQAIADRAGTTKPTLYAHFRDKASLFDSCLRAEADHAIDLLFHAYGRAESMPVSEQILLGVQAFFEYARARPAGYRLLFTIHPSGPATEHREHVIDVVTARISEQIAQRTGLDGQSGQVRQVAGMVAGAVLGAAREALADSSTTPAHAVELAAAFVTQGMRCLRGLPVSSAH
jgi:AcrR family transcriptional regulator